MCNIYIYILYSTIVDNTYYTQYIYILYILYMIKHAWFSRGKPGSAHYM